MVNLIGPATSFSLVVASFRFAPLFGLGHAVSDEALASAAWALHTEDVHASFLGSSHASVFASLSTSECTDVLRHGSTSILALSISTSSVSEAALGDHLLLSSASALGEAFESDLASADVVLLSSVPQLSAPNETVISMSLVLSRGVSVTTLLAPVASHLEAFTSSLVAGFRKSSGAGSLTEVELGSASWVHFGRSPRVTVSPWSSSVDFGDSTDVLSAASSDIAPGGLSSLVVVGVAAVGKLSILTEFDTVASLALLG